MFKYISLRILLAFISLIILTIIVFLLLNIQFTKNPPVDITNFTNKDTKEQDYIDYMIAKGLFTADENPKNVIQRFFDMVSQWFKEEPAIFYQYDLRDTSVKEVFFGRLRYTLLLSIPSSIISLIIGTFLGYWAGYKAGKNDDRIIVFIVTLFTALPSFLISLFFILVASNAGLPAAFVSPDIDTGLSAKSLITPIIVLSVVGISGLAISTRNEVSLILRSEYIQIARAKGLKEFDIFKKYVFRNSCIPWSRYVVALFLSLLSGSWIIENFFAIPGSSTLLIDSINSSEIQIVMFNLIFFTSISFAAAIFIDILTLLIDPRIRLFATAKTSNSQILLWSYKNKIRARKENKAMIESINKGEMKDE